MLKLPHFLDLFNSCWNVVHNIVLITKVITNHEGIVGPIQSQYPVLLCL